MKTNPPNAPVMNPQPETTQEFFEHRNASPIAPNPTTELEATRLAENVANTENATEIESRAGHGVPLNPNDPNVAKRGLSQDPRFSPNQQPVVHGGFGVGHIPGTEIVVGGPTQQ